MPDPRELAAEIAKYEARLASEPRSRIFAQLADAYRKAGRLDEAIRTCRAGLRDHPTYASARMVLGRALSEKGQLREAEKELAIVLELSPGNTVAHRLLGDLAAAQGRRDEARGRYETALGLSPQDREAREALQRLAAPPASARETPEGALRKGPGEPAAASAAAGPPDAGGLSGEGLEAPPEPGASSEAVGVATETLADLYAQQGFAERAAEIYQELLRQEPGRLELREKLDHVQAGAPVPAGAEAAGPVRGSGIALLERWREAARRRKGSAPGGGT
ncbi:MAG: tetratricopeptide repeat protein [candidate division NC10 bacterium]|nr:tetratricopeptide repeat protein [candidate division NC10 bacterium]